MLQQVEASRAIFHKLLDYGHTHMDDKIVMDYFSVSLPDFLVFDVDLQAGNRLHCHYIIGLGHLGLGDTAAAQEHFAAVLQLDANHPGATIHSRLN